MSIMPRSSRNRDSNSRRSRSSSSRSRSRHHHHRHHSINSHLRQLYRFRQKQKEKNYLAALCSMVAIVVMCTALSEPKWISLRGGGCTVANVNVDHLGAYQFFYPGKFLPSRRTPVYIGESTVQTKEYKYGPGDKDIMTNCVTSKAVILMKAIISFTFIAMFCTLGAFLLDLVGPSRRALRILRRNAMLNIVAVIMCVIVNLFCYWLTAEVKELQKLTKLNKGSKVYVTFDISFYLIAAAGGMGVIATALNCLRRYPVYDENPSEALLDDYDGMEAILPPEPDASPLSNMPPPPAYTP